MEPKLKLFTDSAADLPRSIREQYDVDVVPLSVMFGDREYKDNVTLTPEEFYRLLASDPELPSTNQVNPHEFAEAFRPYVEAGQEILYIGLSHSLSGTFQSAVIAREMLNTDRIHVFDTHSASLGESLYVLRAGELAEADYPCRDHCPIERHRERALGLLCGCTGPHRPWRPVCLKHRGWSGPSCRLSPSLPLPVKGTVEVRDKVRTVKALQSLIDKAHRAILPMPQSLLLTPTQGTCSQNLWQWCKSI